MLLVGTRSRKQVVVQHRTSDFVIGQRSLILVSQKIEFFDASLSRTDAMGPNAAAPDATTTTTPPSAAPRNYVALVLGPKLVADNGEWGTYAWSQVVLGTPGMRVAGGTDEVMRNIIGERVLGLPKEHPPR